MIFYNTKAMLVWWLCNIDKKMKPDCIYYEDCNSKNPFSIGFDNEYVILT